MLMVNHLIGFGSYSEDGEQTITWNPSDKDADITLSGSNLIATASGVGSVRATVGRSSGKRYFEIANISTVGSSDHGAANASMSLATTAGQSANSGSQTDLGQYVTGWTQAQAGTFNTNDGDVYQFAIDFSLGYMWAAVANTWLAGGNPAAGTTPWVTGLSGLTYPAWGSRSSGAASLRTKTAQFTGTVPSGFISWATP